MILARHAARCQTETVRLPPFRRPPWSHVLLATAVGIPFITSSLGGLTHRVSCKTEYTSDFDVLTDGQSNAVVSSALVLTRDTATVKPRCPGFGVDIQVNPAGRQTLTVYLRAANASTNELTAKAGTRAAWAAAAISSLPRICVHAAINGSISLQCSVRPARSANPCRACAADR